VKWSKAKKLRFLSNAPVARIATVSKQGRPQVTPVCHVVSQGKIYWASDLNAVKLANISHRRWVAVEYDIYKADWRTMGGVMAQGKARVIRSGTEFRRIRGLLYRKFKVYKSNAPFEEGESLIIEVRPENWFQWWYR
jgi:nitroimidazol reductase NimA-like FMN-containing flavoprotein (pyridoxamine 5'-phosphate oxidase superfamily)